MKIFNKVLKGQNLEEINIQNLNNKIWKEIVLKKIRKNQKNFNLVISSSILPLLFSLEFFKKKFKILDYGSGSMDVYFELNALLKNLNIKYKKKSKQICLDMVELPVILDIYKKVKFSSYFKCNFFDNFKMKKYDVIYISNTLHYINKPEKLIKLFIKSESKYIIINSTRINKTKKFITLQKFYKYKIPTWFFDEKYLISLFKKKYDLIFTSDYLDTYLGKRQEIPMKNFKKRYRLKNTKTLIFKKNRLNR